MVLKSGGMNVADAVALLALTHQPTAFGGFAQSTE
jgi:hypothetical protein